MGSLWSALALVFVAELGDKTQLVALGLGARHRVVPVLVGMAIGYGAANLVAVVVGGALGAALPSRTVGIAGAALFLGFAVWTLFGSGDDDDGGDAGDGRGAQPATLTRAVVVSAAVAMFVAEFGDKTQLATLTLAAQGNPVLVWVGATVGVLAAGAVGVLAGRTVGSRLSGRATRIGSAALFAIFGIVLLISSW
jgi:putative Ca2+/H+ antiporter (TMEM165/GDT1 family)